MEIEIQSQHKVAQLHQDFGSIFCSFFGQKIILCDSFEPYFSAAYSRRWNVAEYCVGYDPAREIKTEVFNL